jgi:hypothetical protein
MTGDTARLVLHADPQARLPFVTPVVPSDEGVERAERTNREVVERAAADDLLPHWRRLDANGETAEEGTLVDCASAHAPNTFAGFGMVTVVGVDLSDGIRAGIATRHSAGVMAGGQTVYANAEHLYVAAPEWVDWPQLSGSEALAAMDGYGTDVHRFDISDPTSVRYEFSGHVDGELVDQFAMDELDGNLRVATTTGRARGGGDSTSESHVTVLAPREGALNEIGRVGGLGRGETIQSVRFAGAIGYVVTFRQTDPLYTIDLSDPGRPRVAGELKMLGYSAYLHPVGDGKLLGVGQDATAEGRQLGTQVALFDVGDPAKPTRVAQATLPGASSNAEWEHRAFLWWPATNLATIPLSAWEPQPFEGLVGFTIEPAANTVAERGRVTHPTFRTGARSEREPGLASGFRPPVARAFVAGGELWTLSSTGLQTSDLGTLSSTGFVAFPHE